MRYGRFILGVILTLLLVGLVAGVGFTAYNMGVMQGAVVSGNLTPPVTGGVAPAAPYAAPFWFYGPFGFHRPFGFGLVGCFVPLLFILLVFVLARLVFRPRWGMRGGPWMRGDWDPARGDVPERVKEWHKKLHDAENQAPTS